MKRIRIGLYGAVMAGAVAVIAAVATSASASTEDVLSYGSAGRTNVAVGNVLSSSLQSGTDASFGSVECSQSTITQEVTSNPASPGTAETESESQTFGDCSESGSVSVSNYTTEISDTDGTVTTVPTVSIVVSGGSGSTAFTCVYKATNVTGDLSFSDVPFHLQAPIQAHCSELGATIDVSIAYAQPEDTSVSGDPTVYAN